MASERTVANYDATSVLVTYTDSSNKNRDMSVNFCFTAVKTDGNKVHAGIEYFSISM